MFSDVKALPPDAILGISKMYAADERPTKVDLGVGVFRTIDGVTPVMKAVSKAQNIITQNETSKIYTPPEGAPGFTDSILELVFGSDHEAMKAGRCVAIQAPGGCGALRLAGELLARNNAASLSVGTPTWPNHKPLLSAAGLTIKMIPYYDKASASINFDAFLNEASSLGQSDVLLVHGACHNPTGADLNAEQINALIDVAEERGFLPLIDTAYHGFAKDLDTDAFIIREMARRLPEVLVTYSCSKNFGLYRERTGALILVGATAEQTAALKTHGLNIARANYSMPPAHGGAIVSEILRNPELNQLWRTELAEMNAAVQSSRALLVDAASKVGLGNQLSYITEQNGMFSLLPVSDDDVVTIREEHGVYMVGGGRVNMCGVNVNNADYLANALKQVMNR